jgi:hypothetical protein
VNKALLDTDIYSELLKAVDQTVTANGTTYRRAQGILTLSTVTKMEIIRGYLKWTPKSRPLNPNSKLWSRLASAHLEPLPAS